MFNTGGNVVTYGTMPDDKLIREPDENSGPAVLDREPIILPKQRREAVQRSKKLLDEMRQKFK